MGEKGAANQLQLREVHDELFAYGWVTGSRLPDV
jgi:hypothetical protein